MIINKETYISRMESAWTHKKTIIQKLQQMPQLYHQGSIILDYGCGGGHLSFMLAKTFPQAVVIGYDQEPEMIEEARRKYEAPNLVFHDFLARSLSYDAIVLSSVLHEVYSSGHSPQSLLINLKSRLKQEGQIIIRDGLKQSNKTVSYYIYNPIKAYYFLKTLQRGRFGSYYHLVSIDDGYIEGPGFAVAEFLNKYTWGAASLKREKNEIVGFWSLSDWQQLETNFHVESEVVLADDYFDHLNKLVYIPERHKWDTHVIVSLKKISYLDLLKIAAK